MEIKENMVIDVKIKLEAFITEREGMLAENAHRLNCGNSIAYSNEAFFELAERIRKLVKEKP